MVSELLNRTAYFASPLGEVLMFYSMRGRETHERSLDASDSISLTSKNEISLTVGGTTITLTKNDITLRTCGTTVKLDFAVDAKSEGGGHLRLDGNAAAEGVGGQACS